MVKVLYFGKLRDQFREKSQEFTLPSHVNSISKLIDHICDGNIDLSESLREISVRYVVNEEMGHIESAIHDKDEVAFLPPVSGG